MLALALALTVLFEMAIQIARLSDNRKAKRRLAEGRDTWDPDAPSPIDTSPSRIEAPAAVDAPAPVAPPVPPETVRRDRYDE